MEFRTNIYAFADKKKYNSFLIYLQIRQGYHGWRTRSNPQLELFFIKEDRGGIEHKEHFEVVSVPPRRKYYDYASFQSCYDIRNKNSARVINFSIAFFKK